MSNKTLSLSQQDQVHFIGSFNQQFSHEDLSKIQIFLQNSFSLSLSNDELAKLEFQSRSVPLSEHLSWMNNKKLLHFLISLSNSLPGNERIIREREIIFSLAAQEVEHSKKLIKAFCLDFKIKPNDLIIKLFARHLDLALLNLLPDEFSMLLARTSFYERCFNPDINDSLQWLSSSGADTEESRLAVYFKNGETSCLSGKMSRAIKSWSARNYQQTVDDLSFVKDLIERRKIQPGKISPCFIPLHIYSLAQTSLPSARKQLVLYKDFLGDSLLIKVCEIYLDLLAHNLKRAVKLLESLQFYHKDFYSDTFFMILARFWCNGELSGKDLLRLKKLLEDYSSSENALMKFELQSLYKEVIGAGDLIENQLLYKHRPLAVFLKTDKSIFDIIEEEAAVNKSVRRLIWLVSYGLSGPDTEAWVEIEPAVQEKGKSGTWKTPELLPWNKFSDPELRSLLNETDKKVFRLLKNTKESLGLDFSLPENEAIIHLCEAENVYWQEEPLQSLRFEEVRPLIEYIEEGGRKLLRWKSPKTPGSLHLEEVDDHIFEVCVLSKSLIKLKEESQTALHLNNSKEELISFFSRMPENLIVEGDEKFSTDSESLQKTEMIARVIPSSGKNYKIQILAGCKGMTSMPGEGRKVLSLKRNKEDIVWERDKDLELSLARQICQTAGLDFEECILPFEWELSEAQKLLSVLESLNNDSSVSLQWPRGGRIKVSSSKGGRIHVKASDRKDWFKIEGEIVFDKRSIKLSEVLKSFKGNSRFVEISKNEFLALSKDLMNGLNEVLPLTDQREECLELHSVLANTLSQRLKDLPLDIEEEFIFRECVTRMIYSRRLSADVPEGLNAQFRPYQEQGYQWLLRLLSSGIGVCLADDMGLGKTIQTLALLLKLKDQGPSLIVAPTSLCHNWSSESASFTPDLNVKAYTGTERTDLLSGLRSGDILICSYGLILQDIDLLKDINWNVIVLDEAQMVKNSGTLRSKSIKLLQSKSRVALSGTPVENHVGELWNIFDFLNPGFLGTRSYFQENYALPIEKKIPGRLEKLKEKVKPFILRRLKKNVLKDLPDSQETVLYVDLNQQEQEIYKASKYLVSKKLNESKKEKKLKRNKIEILAEITRLRKMASNFELSEVYDGISSKSEAVMTKVEELLENEHQALIFSQFTSHLDILEDKFKEQGLLYSRLDGSMNAAARNTAVETFNSGKCSLMLISLKAGGYGLNLTAADFVLHVDPWWNPAVEEQASARAIRIGQKKKVNVLRFITASTIEEEIVKLHAHKKNITEDLLSGTAAAAKLSIEDLLNLLK